MGITHMELICCKEVAHVKNGSCTRYHVHMSLQFVLGIDMMQSNTLTHRCLCSCGSFQLVS